MTYNDVILQLVQRLSANFDQVYHSAELITVGKTRFPAVNVHKEWFNLSPSDATETLYIRRNGDDELYSEERESSCTKAYKMRSQVRIVYFNDNDANQEQVLFKLMQSAILNSTKVIRIMRDKYRLQKDESTGEYEFGPSTCYLAIDLYMMWTLHQDVCAQDFCLEIENPYCLTS